MDKIPVLESLHFLRYLLCNPVKSLRLTPQTSSLRPQARLLVACLCFAVLATTGSAFLGDTLADITKHRGKPSGKPDKHKALWLFEGNDGQLAFAVRFDKDGRSIAETLKPGLIGRSLHSEIVLDFVKAQVATLNGSPTMRVVKVGEKYTFGGQTLGVAEDEYVILDEPKGFLLVWVKGSVPSVTVLSPAALQ